ncbi:MAG: hypothetical protein ACLQDQ_16980 [Myxococcaceae bacterium]
MRRTAGTLFTLVATVAAVACLSAGPPESEICISPDGGECSIALYDAGCPGFPPDASAACPVPGLMCSWGGDLRAECRTFATCGDVAPGWQLSGGSCTLPVPSCPATAPPTTPGGAPCTQRELGLTCVYAATAYTCANGCGGPIVTGQTDVWCVSPLDAGCPPFVPNLGTECQPAGLACDYNACASGGMAVTCQGIWQMQPIACPL